MDNVTQKTMLLLAVAIGGRIALKFLPLPSVEPIIACAVLAGLLYGTESGLTVGALGFFVSNFFVPGGQGIWTFWQAIGGGLTGALAGTTGKHTWDNLSSEKYIAFTALGTILFEMAVNFPYGELFAMPFSLIHIVSSMVIAYLIYLVHKGG